MRVNIERMPGSTVEIDIFADDAEFAEAVNGAYRKIARQVSIPGFRKGKAPRHIIEGMVGRDEIVQEAGQDMMDDLYRRAIEQENLVPVGDPQVGILQQEPIGFKVTVEVFPTVTLGDYSGVRVEPREVEIDQSEVEEVLEQLRKQHSDWVEPETVRMPLDGDKVILDIQVYDGDEQFQEPAEDAEFVLGEAGLFEAISESLKMMIPGSTAELNLAFDEGDETVNPQLWNKELRYVLTLKGVRERILPDVDDDLARKAGPFETFDDMRSQIEKDLLRNKAMEARGEVATAAINAFAETAEVDVPTSMVEKEIEDEITQFRSRLAQQRVTLDEYLALNGQSMDDLREEIRPNAERRIRNSLVLQEVAKAEGVQVTDEDIAGEIERLAGPSDNPERMRTLYQSDYFRGLLENEMFDRKLTDRVLAIATDGVGPVTGAGAEALKQELGAPEMTTNDRGNSAEASGNESSNSEPETAPSSDATETVDEPSFEEAIEASVVVQPDAEAAPGSEEARDAEAAATAGATVFEGTRRNDSHSGNGEQE